jgi:biofilm PGA synthesis N-glycosyltransferase PgaC
VLTVSGVIAAFRKSALYEADFFDSHMVTEDIDTSWKLEKRFWDIRFEPRALCWVLVPETLRGLWRQRLRWAQGGIEVLLKHMNIWLDWRQRRLWPVYIEYLLSAAWAYTLLLLIFFWLAVSLMAWTGLDDYLNIHYSLPLNPIIPKWEGAMLAMACLLQFVVSAVIDFKYEKRGIRYYFWVIWYPFFYWFISALTIVAAVPKALMKRPGTRAVWKSPDRGLQEAGRRA